ncbi:MAG: alpha/beta hydrolase-fold protein [Ornithinibacter sp.]
MLGLTAQPLLIIFALLTVMMVVGAVGLRLSRGPGSRVRELLTRGALVVTAQVLAVATVALVVNNQYGFYASWQDLLGQTPQAAPIVAGGSTLGMQGSVAVFAGRPGGRGSGTTQTMTVRDGYSGSPLDTLVWLPPQYTAKRYSTTKFPVVMFLPGQPSSPAHVFQQYDFGSVASRAIAAGRVKPFVAVFPPLMTDRPRDTECTNVSGGPQALSWLAKDVPTALVAHYRVTRPGPAWSVMGWSTGGFCAAKLLLTRPKEFHAAVSFGGYFDAITDSTTGDLFHGSAAQRQQNSPRFLYREHGLRGGRLLVVVGKQDRESWASARPLLAVSGSDPGVSHVAFPEGGHNFKAYRTYLVPALQWLDQSGI